MSGKNEGHMEVRGQFLGKSDKTNKYGRWFFAPINTNKHLKSSIYLRKYFAFSFPFLKP